MPTITFRLETSERTAVEAAAALAGITVSDYIREALSLRAAQPDLAETVRKLVERSNNAIVVGTIVDDHETRLQRIEQLANLD
jgi:uncharacterized protein (DUF1778 family)